MRILGIDPGIGRLGWGVIEVTGSKIAPIAYGCLETPKEDHLPARLKSVYHEVSRIITEFVPQEVSVEELFFGSNTTTAFSVGQARGVVLLTADLYNLPVSSYTPMQVKLAVSGYGKADKNQIGQMVKLLLKLPVVPKRDDTADALAIAITHAFSRKMMVVK